MKKKLLLIVVAIMCFFTLSSCGNKVYREYNSDLCEISKDNPFEVISKKSLVKLLNKSNTNDIDNEIIYVFYADSSLSTCSTTLEIVFQQAVQYGIEKIYYLDSSKISASATKRDELKQDIGMNDPSIVPALMAFVDGKISFDNSKTTTKTKYDGSYTRMCYYTFVELPNSLK